VLSSIAIEYATKLFTLFFKFKLYIICQVIHTFEHHICRKTDIFKKLLFFEPKYFCCLHYTLFRILAICKWYWFLSDYFGYSLIKVAWTTALFFFSVATVNIFCCHCKSHLRFFNLSSHSFPSRTSKFIFMPSFVMTVQIVFFWSFTAILQMRQTVLSLR
jgi:hypothetical protein